MGLKLNGTFQPLVYIYIFVKLQLSFNPVSVVQQYNRQLTHISHIKAQTQYKNTTINDTTTANTHNTASYNK
jgi:hypothetical protein